jgi:hypothetical protein
VEAVLGIALLLSVVLGLVWNLIAVVLLGGRSADALRPGWLAAGVVAGLVAGLHTIWSRARRAGGESLGDVLANYGLGIVAYWLAFLVVERVRLCLDHGGWTDFGLGDHLRLLPWLVYGSVLYGVVLIPLAVLSRILVWKAFARAALSKG